MDSPLERFNHKIESDEKLRRFIEKLENDRAGYLDADEYGKQVARLLDKVTREYHISAENAAELLGTLMPRDHEVVSDYVADTQTRLNHRYGHSMRAVRKDFDRDRMEGLIKYITDAEELPNDLLESFINFNQALVAETAKMNAEFQSEAGMHPKIVRRYFGGDDWCKNLQGTYIYPDEVPDDVYRRHKNCRCTIEFLPGDGRRQNVHTKQWIDDHKKEVDNRIKKSNQPHRKIKDVPSKKFFYSGVKNGEIGDNVNEEKQFSHLEETVTENRSYIYGGMERAKELYERYKGKGYTLTTRSGDWAHKEFIKTDERIGKYRNEDGSVEYDSRELVIVHSKTGAHLYPGKMRF